MPVPTLFLHALASNTASISQFQDSLRINGQKAIAPVSVFSSLLAFCLLVDAGNAAAPVPSQAQRGASRVDAEGR